MALLDAYEQFGTKKYLETALLVEPNNSKELALAIDKFAEDVSLRLRLASGARKEVEKQYTWKKNVEQVNALLDQA